jgi:hypothetical protein
MYFMTEWGEPRPGTEAYAVKQEVARRQKMAREKGLDQLLSDAYHNDGLQQYEAWLNSEKNKRWVHPEVTGVVSGKDQVRKEQVPFIEFSMAGDTYKVTCREWRDEADTYNDLTLYMNGQRIFEIGEVINRDQYRTTYRPSSISAYVNDEWVGAFKKIKDHHQRMRELASIEYAEDKKRLQETKDAFGIVAIPSAAQIIPKRDEIVPVSSASTAQQSSNKFAILIVIAVFLILAALWAAR